MQITALVENTSSRPDIGAEHGLSLYIEAAGRKILFDTGQTELFAANAAKLGVDLSQVELAVLSHGHYDHGGGLARFLQLNRHAPVYLHPLAFRPYYNGERYIGLDPQLQNEPRLRFVSGATQLAPGLTLFDCSQQERRHDLGSFGLTMQTNGGRLPDDFRHEQYLLIEEAGLRVLISGCSHKGIMDITQWFQPDYLIGGFHFSTLPLDEALAGYARFLAQFPTQFYTCHCTGCQQFQFMQQHMPNLHYLAAGDTITI